jgi:hypothetical protein
MNLNGRLRKLEGVFIPHVAPGCPTCGLRHVQPSTLEMARSLIRLGDGPINPTVTCAPVPPLCLCACCADSRMWGELTHPELKEQAFNRYWRRSGSDRESPQ